MKIRLNGSIKMIAQAVCGAACGYASTKYFNGAITFIGAPLFVASAMAPNSIKSINLTHFSRGLLAGYAYGLSTSDFFKD